MADTAKITIGDKSVELPVLQGTDGPPVVDIRKLYGAAIVGILAIIRWAEIIRWAGSSTLVLSW